MSNPLRKYRLEAGLTQFQLAVRAGMSLTSVSLAERTGYYTYAMSQRLADALAISADCLRPSGRKPGPMRLRPLPALAVVKRG